MRKKHIVTLIIIALLAFMFFIFGVLLFDAIPSGAEIPSDDLKISGLFTGSVFSFIFGLTAIMIDVVLLITYMEEK